MKSSKGKSKKETNLKAIGCWLSSVTKSILNKVPTKKKKQVPLSREVNDHNWWEFV